MVTTGIRSDAGVPAFKYFDDLVAALPTGAEGKVKEKVVTLLGDIFGLDYALEKCCSGGELKHLG